MNTRKALFNEFKLELDYAKKMYLCYFGRIDQIISLAARLNNMNMISHDQYCSLYNIAYRGT